MKVHTTNYIDTFIEIAEDAEALDGIVPPARGDARTVAQLQYEMLADRPYAYTSDDVLFTVYATRKELSDDELAEQRAAFFSKGQPSFRASPLTKTYGWGVHNDSEGRIAIYPVGSEAYNRFLADPSVKKVKAMRSKKG
ncbi:MAG: DUF6157 family protein [Rhodothermales bacterium]